MPAQPRWSVSTHLSSRSRALVLTRLYRVSMTTTDQCQPPPLPLPPFPFNSPAGNFRSSPQTQAEFNASSPLLTHPLSSICLRGICTFVPLRPSRHPLSTLTVSSCLPIRAANIILNQPCSTDSTVYVGYSPANVAFTNVVSRDNCVGPGLYCDPTRGVCLEAKADGGRCGGDKECLSVSLSDPLKRMGGAIS